ncbi:MAG: hypothetical protein KGK34_06265 [Chloroflexota bacterium]|nr:hypothetical protein [Chloroflexota bacterium]
MLLVDAGLRVVAVEGVVLTFTDFALADRLVRLTECAESAASAGVITPEESSRWLAELDDQSRRGALVASVGGYMALGEKPL